MINDGYSLILSLGDHAARFRPLLHRDRVAVAEMLSRIGTREIVASLLVRQMEWSTFTMDWILGQDDRRFVQLWRTILGVGRSAEERKDEDDLRRGVRLRMQYSHIKGDVCKFCRKYWFDPKSGKITTPVLTERSGPVPCESEGVSCPSGHWSRPNHLSPKNEAAFRFHMECRSTGSFPTDSIVSRNARIIEEEMRSWMSAKSPRQ